MTLRKIYFKLRAGNTSTKEFLIRHLSFFSYSIIATWLFKELFTTALFNRSFAGRNIVFQLIIFSGLTIGINLLVIMADHFYQNTHNKTTLDHIIYSLQLFILLASYLRIIINFEYLLYDLPGFFLFFLVNLVISTTQFIIQNHHKNKSAIQASRKAINIVAFLIVIIFLEFNVFNQNIFLNSLQNLSRIEYEVDQGTLFGFSLQNGELRSKHNDPNITFSNIDTYVRYLEIQCYNPNPDAVSQVYYRKEHEGFSEDKSLTFPLSNNTTIISLPRTIKISSLRFDLTNIEGDTLYCQGITLNPRLSYSPNYSPNYSRLALYGFIILGLIYGDKFIKPETSTKLMNLFINNGLWIFIFLILLIGFTYPVTITFDSGHYLWLANLIRQGEWANWDLIRYPGFPTIIFISTSVFGLTQNALLIPMIIAQVLLFLFSYQIIVNLIRPKHNISRIVIALMLFIVVGLDPTVMGYYHTLLTEYPATTLAIISVYLSIKLYKTPFLSKPFLLQSALFLLLVPFGWHLKQPYIGAAFFPFFLLSSMIVFRHFSWKTIGYFFTMNFALLAIVLASTSAWYGFLQARGNPMREDRQVARNAENIINYQTEISREDPQSYLKTKLDEYLAISNYYLFDFDTWSVDRTSSFQRANENSAIAHRMFKNPGRTNTFYSFYSRYTYPFQTAYTPPPWVNNIFFNRISLSNSIFTFTFLILPFFVILMMFLWIRYKSVLNAGLLILSASSLLNALAHLLLAPNDRYSFWGYVFNLLVLILLSAILIRWLTQKIKTISSLKAISIQNKYR